MMRRTILLCALLALVTLPTVTTRIYASDEVQYFAFLRSLAFDGDLSFQNEYQHFHDAGAGGSGFHDTFLAERFTAAGRRINFGTIGPALLWAPFYAVGHVVAGLTGAPQDGYSAPYVAAVAYGSAFYGWMAIALSALMAQRVVGRGLAPALAVGAGTPLIFYMFVAPPFSHACATFAVALFLWVWLHVRHTWTLRGVVALGLTGGLMGTMRDQTVLFLLVPAIDFLRCSLRHQSLRETMTRAGVGALCAIAAFAPHLIASYAINGYIGPHESVGNKMSWSSPHFFEVLISPAHGWFAWTPLAVLALAGLVALALGRTRTLLPDGAWIGACALVMVLLQVYINGAVESWTVAGAFGQRRFVELTPLLVLGLAVVFSTDQQPRRLAWAAVLACVWWNLGLLVQFGTHRMDRQRLTLSDNAWVTFVELPREGPALAWRYLTDRDSFYGQSRQ
ncbi:MAG: hypothetical protein O2917_01750 [Acidobacteria bacterium]|nr:hypothetical protein [Acidobacteriota bacterium]